MTNPQARQAIPMCGNGNALHPIIPPSDRMSLVLGIATHVLPPLLQSSGGAKNVLIKSTPVVRVHDCQKDMRHDDGLTQHEHP